MRFIIALAAACAASGAAAEPLVIGHGETYYDQQLEEGDGFGRAVALHKRMLAVGAPYDNGRRGAVYLYSFADDAFSRPRLELTIGAGLTGPNTLDLPLDANDEFGISVALDKRRLVIGARGDDGPGVPDQPGEGRGAVYLFTFEDERFGGLKLEGVMGAGYAGEKNVDVPLGADNFGWDVALEGRKLAVAAVFDDGADKAGHDKGAVHLFTFASEDFKGAVHRGVVGDGYRGAGDFHIPLDDEDAFAHAVDIESGRLIIGADKDDGFDNEGAPGVQREYGALYMLTFKGDFENLALRGVMGRGYRGAGDVEVALDERDFFGAVGEMEGRELAMGTPGDDGVGDLPGGGFGAVHLFRFKDDRFGGGRATGAIGRGYAIDVPRLTRWERLGYFVAFDGGRIAAGAPLSDGAGGGLDADRGAVYLFPRALLQAARKGR